MGNIGTKTDACSIFLQTRNPYYSPHQLVEGAVYIDVYQVVSVQNLKLRLKGVEKVKWEELKAAGAPPKPGEKMSDQIKEKFKDKNDLFKLDINLFSIGGNLMPGQYQYPFCFQLPDGIPGTFAIKHGDYEGRVKYTLCAYMEANHRNDLKYKTELVVRQNPPSFANYNAPVTKEQAVCICCISKGRTHLTCNFARDAYMPGEVAQAICRADNSQCSVPIKNFTIALIQKIVFRTKRGKNAEFSREITRNPFPGIGAGASNTDKPIMLDLKLEDPHASLMAQGKDATHALLQPNVQGGLLTCNYEMKVYPIYDAPCSCCSSVPETALPLFIYAAPLANWVQSAPMGFTPKIFDVQNIVIPAVKLDMLPSISISGGIGMPGVSMNVSGNSGVSMHVSEPSLHVSGPSMHVSGHVSGPSMHVSGPTMHVSSPTMHVSGATMHTNIGDAHVDIGGGVHARVDVPVPSVEVHTSHMHISEPAVHARIDMPGVDMNVRTDVSGNVSSGEVRMDVNMPTATAKFTF